jgi:hypothetical protein
MPIAIHSFMLDPDGEIHICHTFFGLTKAQALELQDTHAQHCPQYGPAVRQGNTIDIVEEIESMPVADEEELLEFLDLSTEEEDEDE